MSATIRLTLYVGVASAILNPALVFAPLLVGGIVSSLDLSTSAAVAVISAELFATALASIPALWWVVDASWRKVANLGLATVALGNLLSIWCDSFLTLILVRTVTGLFEGSLLALFLAIIARTKEPERIFGAKLALQMVTSAVGIGVLSLLTGEWGVKAIFVSLALATAVLLLCVGNDVCITHARSNSSRTIISATVGYRGFAVLIALFLFGAGVNVAWTYLERIGSMYGYAIQTIGWMLSLSMVVAVLSGLLCAALGARFGRILPAIIALGIGISGAILLMLASASLALFIAGVCFVSIARVVPAPYLFGLVALLDRNGKLAVLSHIALAAGMAAGPALATLFYGGGNIASVLMIGILFMLMTSVLILKLATLARAVKRPDSPLA